MPLLEVTTIKKVTATVALEESTAKQVDQYAAFLNAPADEVINKALAYVFGKDKDFQQYRESSAAGSSPASLRVKRPIGAATGAKRGRRPSVATAH